MLLIVLLAQKEKRVFVWYFGFQGTSVFKVLIIYVAAVTTAENGRRALEFLGLGDDQSNTLEGRVSYSKKRDNSELFSPFNYWTLSRIFPFQRE